MSFIRESGGIMIDFFLYRRFPSHYEEEAQGPTLTVTKAVLTTNEKIVEACKDLDSYARAYIPAPELTQEQKRHLQELETEREIQHMRYDTGFWRPPPPRSSFRIRDSEITDNDLIQIFGPKD